MSNEVKICGSPHKIGLGGKVFMLIDGEWVRSNKPAAPVKKILEGSPENKDGSVLMKNIIINNR